MGFYVHYLALQIFIVFEACAFELNHQYEEENLINNNFENINAIINSTLFLQCPKKSSEMKWKLLKDTSSMDGQILQTN